MSSGKVIFSNIGEVGPGNTLNTRITNNDFLYPATILIMLELLVEECTIVMPGAKYCM